MSLILATASDSLSDAPHLNEGLERHSFLSGIPMASEGSLVKTFKMLKRLVFSRGNVNFGICA